MPSSAESIAFSLLSLIGLAVTIPAAAKAQASLPSDVPASFAANGRQPIVTAHGVGAQIYECKAATDGTRAWTFREPIASLIDNDRTIGRHYVGPNWDLADGSGVTGKVVSSTPGAGPQDIPQLALRVVEHRGTGALKEAELVLRLHTAGGALKGPCERTGDLKSVPYAADYVFLR